MNASKYRTQHVFVTDDDEDDRLLFQEVINELPELVHLTTARDGEETINTLLKLDKLPDLLFLDLNMPLKNGLECLREIKQNQYLAVLPVIIFSTSSYPAAINQAYDQGAHLYIRKPNDFLTFKKSIQQVLAINWSDTISRPPREEFVFTAQP